MPDYDGFKALTDVAAEIEKIKKKFGLYKEISGGEPYPLIEDTLGDIRGSMLEAITKEIEKEKEETKEKARAAGENADERPEPKKKEKSGLDKVIDKLTEGLLEGFDAPPPANETPEERKAREEAECCKLKALAALAAAKNAGGGGAGGAGGDGGAGGPGGSGSGGSSSNDSDEADSADVLGGFRRVIGDGGEQKLIDPDSVFVRSETAIWCLDVCEMEWREWDAQESILSVEPKDNAILIVSKSKAVVFNVVRGTYGPVLYSGAALKEGKLA